MNLSRCRSPSKGTFFLDDSMKKKIEQIIKPLIEEQGAVLIDVAVRGERGGTVVEIFIDSIAGIDADRCAEVSRLISPAIEVAAVISGRYHLIVSSPGVDRPLQYDWQYARHAGRKMRVEMRGKEGISQIEGELQDTDERGITLRPEKGESLHIGFAEIVKAVVVPRW